MSILFDLNKRIDLILKNFSPNTSERIVSIALPFLSLNSTTASFASAGVGAFESYHLLEKVRENRDAASLARLAVVVSSTVLGIFFPIGQFIISNSVMLVVHIKELFQDKNWVKKTQAILKIADQVIHVGSIYYGSSRWIALSMLSQICSELYQAQNFVRKDRKWPEAFAHFTLAGIRSYKTYSLLFPPQEKQTAPLAPVSEQTKGEKLEPAQKVETIVQEILPAPIPEQTVVIEEKPLTQEEWDHIYSSFNPNRKYDGEKPNIELVLEQRGISKHIEGIDFKKTDRLNDLIWTNLHLKNCDFTNAQFKRSIFENVHADSCLFKKTRWTNSIVRNSFFESCDFKKTDRLNYLTWSNLHLKNCDFTDVKLKRSVFDNVHADSCLFNNSSWIGSIVRNSFFNNCDFKFAELVQARLETLRFTNCDFTRTCFNESMLTQSTFVFSKLMETIFLDTTVDKGQLIDSDLTDTLLLDTKEHFDIQGFSEHRITRPIVAMGGGNSGIFTPQIARALRDNDVIPLCYNQYPSYVDSKLLKAEIVAGLKDLKDVESIPQELLRRAKDDSQIGKIRQKAAAILKHCHGHVLPGGGDIEPVFYGEMEDFYHPTFRSMFEFALIEQSHQNKIPTLGICRGAQMINVYFGGTLQNVGEQDGYHLMEFMDSPHGEWLQKLIQGKFFALSMHHQAVKKIGQGLHPILKRGDVIKFLVSEDGTFMASQTHPEDYLNFKNRVNGEEIIENGALSGLSAADHLQNNKNIYQYFVQKTQAAFKPAEKA